MAACELRVLIMRGCESHQRNIALTRASTHYTASAYGAQHSRRDEEDLGFSEDANDAIRPTFEIGVDRSSSSMSRPQKLSQLDSTACRGASVDMIG